MNSYKLMKSCFEQSFGFAWHDEPKDETRAAMQAAFEAGWFARQATFQQ